MNSFSEENTQPSISVVVPVYGCAGCLEQLCDRLIQSLQDITNRFEILLVDDRSPDDSLGVIRAIQLRHSEVECIRLSRNFGQHIAISAGLSVARGDYSVVMDCDLQDPPEIIPELFAKIKEGYDLVMARRAERSHSHFRIFAAKAYFWLLSKLNEEDIDGSYGSFCMLSRKVVNSFLEFNERERHFLFILRWLGFKMGSIEYAHQERTIGNSSYSLKRLLRHAIDGIFFQSTVFLRWIVSLGLLFSILGIILALYFVFQYFAYGSVVGWTSLIVILLVCTGVILSSMGVIGLYVGKIFDQTKGRPLYVIDTIVKGRATW
ncbi:glycosyltransferase family 2 protein [Azonexus sp. IMCC34842]|uniref:glycosyltransferase family 2 protein n=1 Tax=Azonexus sp. IMCC34842 TaxID=3420950 RepID=UPI003D141F65